jgi:hypothetical protein
MKTPVKQEKKVVKSAPKEKLHRIEKVLVPKKPMKPSQTALEKKNTRDAMENKNMRPPFEQKVSKKTAYDIKEASNPKLKASARKHYAMNAEASMKNKKKK